jgi:hypothetical protein
VIGDHLEGGEEAVLLRGEVAVDGATGDAGRGRDPGDRRLVVTMLGDGGDNAGGKPLTLVLDHELAGQSVTARRQPGSPCWAWDPAERLVGAIEKAAVIALSQTQTHFAAAAPKLAHLS